METLVPMTVIFLLALISPGPDFILCVRNSIRYSKRAAQWTALGIALGILVHMTYCILGIGLIISKSILLFNILKYLGAAYLICIGIMSFMSKEEGIDIHAEKEEKSISTKDALKTGFLVNVLNPKATLAFVSIFSAFITPETAFMVQVGFAAIATLSTLFWYLFVVQVFSIRHVRSVFAKSRNRIDRTIGVILVSLGLRVVDV